MQCAARVLDHVKTLEEIQRYNDIDARALITLVPVDKQPALHKALEEVRHILLLML